MGTEGRRISDKSPVPLDCTFEFIIFQIVNIKELWVNDNLKSIVLTNQSKSITTNTKRNKNTKKKQKRLQRYDDNNLSSIAQQSKKLKNTINDIQLELNEEEKNKDDDNNNEISEKDKIKLWLENTVKLPEYFDKFIEDGVDEFDTILLLDHNTLKDIGINKVGHRLKILNQINILKQKNNNNNNNEIAEQYDEGNVLLNTQR